MKAVLIAPAARRGVGHLSDVAPLIAAPLMGETLASYWIEHLSGRGFKEVTLLVTDRPETVRQVVGDGARWGVRLTIEAELSEPTLEETRAKHPGSEVVLLDRFPGSEHGDFFASYSGWLKGAVEWMPHAAKANRIGLREKEPGIWIGLRAQVASSAILKGPCWIGENTRVGPDVVVGPNTIIENDVALESACEVQDSWVGPETFVGSLTRIKDSLAWGSRLINVRTNSCTHVPDAFLLSSLSQKSGGGAFSERLAAIFQSSLTRPLGLLSTLTQRNRR